MCGAKLVIRFDLVLRWSSLCGAMEKPEYRSGRRLREVKVYTVCQESRLVLRCV